MDHPKYAENLIAVPTLQEPLTMPALDAPRDLSRKERRALEATLRHMREQKAALDFRGKMLAEELKRVVNNPTP